MCIYLCGGGGGFFYLRRCHWGCAMGIFVWCTCMYLGAMWCCHGGVLVFEIMHVDNIVFHWLWGS